MFGALPKPGSTVVGPMPAEWVGTEKKGKAGPRQKKCEAGGGYWVGQNAGSIVSDDLDGDVYHAEVDS